MKLVAFARRFACVLPVVAVVVLDASVAWASHPLLTGDTGVLGKGGYELGVHGERTRAAGDRSTEAVLKLGHGLGETLDVEVELPYMRTVAGGSATSGRGDAGLGAKWRFFENDAFSMALKPALLLPTGRDELGLGAGRARWGLNLAAAYELGRFELLAHQSVAVRFGATEKLRLVADLARDTSADPQTQAHAREAMLGAVYAPSDAIDLGLGFRKVLNDAADERGVRAGIKLRW